MHVNGWDDCLDAVRYILGEAKDLEDAKQKIEGLQVLVKAKKFEAIKVEFGVIDGLF